MIGHPLYCRAKISSDLDDYPNESWIPENAGNWIEGYYFKIVDTSRYIHYIVPNDLQSDHEEIMWYEFKIIDPETLELHTEK